MAKIKVTAGDGRKVPVHSSIATAPGAELLYLEPGDDLEVEESNPLVQRQLRNGDFVRVTTTTSSKAAKPAKES